MNSRIEKWRNWCDERVKPDVYTMHLYRYVMAGVTEITKARELPPSYFFNYLGETYATVQMIAVRRQADKHPRGASLAKLLAEIAEHPSEITREFYVAEWGEDDAPRANKAFDVFAGVEGTHVAADAVRTDLEALVEKAAVVKK